MSLSTVRKQRKAPVTSVHSVRTTEELWERARARAIEEGVTMSYVMNSILEGYADRQLNLPKIVKKYD